MGVNNKESGVWDEKGRVQCGERWNDEGHTVSLLWLGCDLVALGCGWESWRHNWAPFYYVTLSILLSPCPSSSTVQHITGIHNRVTIKSFINRANPSMADTPGAIAPNSSRPHLGPQHSVTY